MSIDILIGNFSAVKPNAAKWDRSIYNFTDSSTVKLPALTSLKKEGDTYEKVQTGLQIQEGMTLVVNAGYNGNKVLRFKGFVSRINFTIPVEIECEGYSYQLRKKLGFTKSYYGTTVKKILTDLVEGTDIKLSDAIPDIPLEKAVFENATGIQVLEWFKTKCLLTVYFIYDVIYVGGLEIAPAKTVKYRLGWNVIKDGDLKFNNKKEFADVRIVLSKKGKKGSKTKTSSGSKAGPVKVLKSVVSDPAIQQDIADQVRKNLVNKGYEGSITAFLEPFAEPGMAAYIEDTKYPERTGTYFITEVAGDFSSSGGRQKVKLGNSL